MAVNSPPFSIRSCYLLTALRVATREAGEATVLVCHLLLTALWALTLRASTILDVLLQSTLNAILPCVDVLVVEVQAVDQRHNLFDWHVVAQYTRDTLRIVPEALVEQT